LGDLAIWYAASPDQHCRAWGWVAGTPAVGFRQSERLYVGPVAGIRPIEPCETASGSSQSVAGLRLGILTMLVTAVTFTTKLPFLTAEKGFAEVITKSRSASPRRAPALLLAAAAACGLAAPALTAVSSASAASGPAVQRLGYCGG